MFYNLLSVIGFSLIVLLSCMFVAYFGKKWNLKPLVAISAGVLLSICFLEFLPEAFSSHNTKETGMFILLGIFIQGFADIYLLPHLSFLDQWLSNKKSKVWNVFYLSPAFLFQCCKHFFSGKWLTSTSSKIHHHSHSLSASHVCCVTGCLAICSFFDGIRLFSALGLTKPVAFATALALFFHLLSEGVLLTILALSSGFTSKALFVLLFFLVGNLILGASLAGWIALRFSFPILMAFSSGILIYICFVHLLPFSLKQDRKLWFFISLLICLNFHFFIH